MPLNERGLTFQNIHIPDLPESLMPISTPTGLLSPEKYSWLKIKSALQQSANLLAQSAGVKKLIVTEPPPNIAADLAIACFPLAAALKKSPIEIAQNLAAEDKHSHSIPEIISAESFGPYLNYKLDYTKLGTEVIQQIEELGSDYGKQDLGHGETVVVDFSSPNVAKPMSVAHLRSTVIGDAICRINEATGHSVVRDNHLGDWGTQFGMLGRAYDLWANEIPELKEGTNAIRGLYSLYVKMHSEIEIEKNKLRKSIGEELNRIKAETGKEPAALKQQLKDPETELEKQGRAWFKNLEAGDPEAEKLRDWASKLSLEEFRRVYSVLGTRFHYELGEGFYVPMLSDVIQAMTQKGLTTTTADGAIEVDLENAGLENLVIQKKDGTSLYATRDLATLAARTAWFSPQRIIYVVGGEQTEYFQQLFESFDRLADGQGPKTEHISFGMLSLPEGKMSTRRGRVVFLEDVLTEAIDRARNKVMEAGRGITQDCIEETARQVGVGAVVYSDLGQSRERNIKFDMEAALSIEKQSAPYIQYARARTVAVLEKAESLGLRVDPSVKIQVETLTERALIKQLAKFPEAIQDALIRNQPSIVAQYTYDLAATYNNFHRQDRILDPANPSTTNTRLRLNRAAGQVILNGLKLLGIDSPAKM